jgi:hypothetical protein
LGPHFGELLTQLTDEHPSLRNVGVLVHRRYRDINIRVSRVNGLSERASARTMTPRFTRHVAMTMIRVTEHTALTDVQRRLAAEFPHATPDDLSAAITHAYNRFSTSPIRDFIPLLVEKRARRQLAGPDSASTA